MSRIWDHPHADRAIDWRLLAPLRRRPFRSAPTRQSFTTHPGRSAYAKTPEWSDPFLARLASPPDTTLGGGVAS